jgi:TPR repeat protein
MDVPQDIPFAATADQFCDRCGRSLTELAPGARFCPRCGFEVSKSLEAAGVGAAEAATQPQAVEAAGVSEGEAPQVRAVEPVPVVWPVFPPPDPSRFHSIMVVGYARALNSLGTRYESGQGVARNTDEALRYFCKAARLGCGDALERLAKRGFDGPDAVASTDDDGPVDVIPVDPPTSPGSPSDPPASPEAPSSQTP